MLISEFLDWRGYIVGRNLKVGKRPKGGWEMELDIVAYNHETRDMVHYEPSTDAQSWEIREARYRKKFEAGKRYIFEAVFPWLPSNTKLRQIAVFVPHPKNRHEIAGGAVQSIDELMAEIRQTVIAQGILAKNAIPEKYPLLRTVQLTHNGYYGIQESGSAPTSVP